MSSNSLSASDLASATAILEQVAADRSLLVALPPDVRQRFLDAVAVVFNPDARARRGMVKATSKARKLAAAARDDSVLNQTGIRALRQQPNFTTPNVFPPLEVTAGDAVVPQHCYICKQKFTQVHHFYDQMCVPCAEFNYAKRTESADLSGRVALLTGGRVKIGYQAGLKLLRAGATLVVTTRFPRDAAARYAREPDSASWSDRLAIFGLDLRHTPSVEGFCALLLERYARLDYVINNACQTVRRPPAFYRHMMQRELAAEATLTRGERQLLGPALPAAGTHDEHDPQYDAQYDAQRAQRLAAPAAVVEQLIGMTHAAALSQIPLLADDALEATDTHFPPELYDADLQQVDRRDRNSWRLTMAEVSSVELLETQLVNAVAPFVLNARLKALMASTPERDKHIVNVSAVEGQFYRNNKTTRHPHTNMAKAALNMMTRTSAADYHQSGIHMNSVDTGWVTDEDTVHLAERKVRDHRFHPPLDIVDGAARIVDPIISGANTGTHVWGQFLKDYAPTDW